MADKKWEFGSIGETWGEATGPVLEESESRQIRSKDYSHQWQSHRIRQGPGFSAVIGFRDLKGRWKFSHDISLLTSAQGESKPGAPGGLSIEFFQGRFSGFAELNTFSSKETKGEDIGVHTTSRLVGNGRASLVFRNVRGVGEIAGQVMPGCSLSFSLGG